MSKDYKLAFHSLANMRKEGNALEDLVATARQCGVKSKRAKNKYAAGYAWWRPWLQRLLDGVSAEVTMCISASSHYEMDKCQWVQTVKHASEDPYHMQDNSTELFDKRVTSESEEWDSSLDGEASFSLSYAIKNRGYLESLISVGYGQHGGSVRSSISRDYNEETEYSRTEYEPVLNELQPCPCDYLGIYRWVIAGISGHCIHTWSTTNDEGEVTSAGTESAIWGPTPEQPDYGNCWSEGDVSWGLIESYRATLDGIDLTWTPKYWGITARTGGCETPCFLEIGVKIDEKWYGSSREKKVKDNDEISIENTKEWQDKGDGYTTRHTLEYSATASFVVAKMNAIGRDGTVCYCLPMSAYNDSPEHGGCLEPAIFPGAEVGIRTGSWLGPAIEKIVGHTEASGTDSKGGSVDISYVSGLHTGEGLDSNSGKRRKLAFAGYGAMSATPASGTETANTTMQGLTTRTVDLDYNSCYAEPEHYDYTYDYYREPSYADLPGLVEAALTTIVQKALEANFTGSLSGSRKFSDKSCDSYLEVYNGEETEGWTEEQHYHEYTANYHASGVPSSKDSIKEGDEVEDYSQDDIDPGEETGGGWFKNEKRTRRGSFNFHLTFAGKSK